MESLTPIQKFFAGSTIFITGATGFMGKCLLEKLLRSCSDIDKIYVLVREKRGKKTEGRIEELFQDCLFSKLKEQSDKYRSKVMAISGDVSAPGLGLNAHDRSRLQQEVNVVFHAAATVNFNEKIKLAIAINLKGTKEILDLCSQMQNLKSVVHVSTAYSNCFSQQIKEKFYKYPISYKDLPFLLDKLSDEEAEELTPRLLGDWPNTYTFTKAMAESLVAEFKEKLPISVFRPAIIVSTWKEPIKGWVDNIYGPTGVCAGALMGVLGSLNMDGRMPANIVPVDSTINGLIACAWYTGIKKETTDILKEDNNNWNHDNTALGLMYQTPNLNLNKNHNSESDPSIFNYVSTEEKPLTWDEFCTINMMHARHNPLQNAIWAFSFNLINSPIVHSINMLFFHLLPALFVDAITTILGKKPRLYKIYKQTVKLINVIAYFTKMKWEFKNDNIQHLWKILDERDKEIFPFSMAEIDWIDYFRNYIPGLRKYLCKEEENTLPKAQRKQKIFLFISTSIKLMFNYISIYMLLCLLKKLWTLSIPVNFIP